MQAGDNSCALSATSAPAGTIRFDVTNVGSQVTEFYLYGEGDRVISEVENIGPGLTRQLVVEVPQSGKYTTACKPGMQGESIREVRRHRAVEQVITVRQPRAADS